MFGIEKTVANAARKAGFVTASAVLATVGTAFLTTAAWIVLSAQHSSLFAATIIGLVYLGAGAITLALGLSRPTQKRPAPREIGGLSPGQLVLVSFLQGLEQGKRTKRPF
jgi:hypothetical protein